MNSSYILIEDLPRLEKACLACIAVIKKNRSETLEAAIKEEMELPDYVPPKKKWWQGWGLPSEKDLLEKETHPAKTREEAIKRLKTPQLYEYYVEYDSIMFEYSTQFDIATKLAAVAKSGTRVVHLTVDDFSYISDFYNNQK